MPLAVPRNMTSNNQLRALGALLRPLGMFAAASLAVLGASRAGLVLWQLPRVEAAHMLPAVFLQGLRFDLVLIGALLMPMTIVLPLLCTSTTLWPTGRRVLAGYLAACLGCIVFMELATPAFIAQFDSRPNRIFLEYLVYPKEVGSTLLAAYLWQVVAAVVAVAAASWLLLRAALSALREARPVRVVTAVVAAPLLFSVCALASRSTFDHRAVNPSTVAISTDPLANDLALSSLYTVLYAVKEARDEAEGGFRYGAMTQDEVLRRVQAEMQIPAADFDGGDIPTLHGQQATTLHVRPKNLVIVLEESLGAEFVGALGGRPLTPNLDALAKQGLWFERMYATGTRSVRGLEALITGFTPTPAQSVIKLGRSQRNFFSIAQLLRNAGYDTSFIYGGEGQFDNMRRFFMNNGFDSVIDEDDYLNPVFFGSWGVADEDVFARADQEFSKPHDRPFFTLLFTTSNHSPYEYPAGRIQPYDTDPHTVNNAVKYADYALGAFFDRARASDYWDDTVFLVVADHNSRVYGAKLVPVEHFHIPALILGGGVEPGVYPPIASQIDLPPTLLSLIGVSSHHPMIGRDLTRPELAHVPGRAILQYGDTQAYMRGNEIAILRKDLPAATFEYDAGAGTLTPREPNDDLVATALAHATWSSTTYAQSLYRLPATPRSSDQRQSRNAPAAGAAPRTALR
jgi:phosphoglycerol transferase MdoB-like AlkP superfamily enzyme